MASRVVRWDRRSDEMVPLEGVYATEEEACDAAAELYGSEFFFFDGQIVFLVQNDAGAGDFESVDIYDFFGENEEEEAPDDVWSEGYWLSLEEQYEDRFDGIDDRY